MWEGEKVGRLQMSRSKSVIIEPKETKNRSLLKIDLQFNTCHGLGLPYLFSTLGKREGAS
jgi:hypothetical protein